jgi:hypothetical protein
MLYRFFAGCFMGGHSEVEAVNRSCLYLGVCGWHMGTVVEVPDLLATWGCTLGYGRELLLIDGTNVLLCGVWLLASVQIGGSAMFICGRGL